jgi:outer membrane lipoprotein-sorting protein
MSGVRRAAACLAVLCVSCGAPALMKLPSGSGAPVSDVNEALAEATAACEQVRTLSAEVAVTGTLRGRKVRGRLLVGFSAPASARIEAVAPFGPPLFFFAAVNDEGTLLLPRDDRYLTRAPAAALLEAVAGVPFGPADLKFIMSGCGADNRSVVAGQAFGTDWRRVETQGMTELFLHHDTAWRLVAAVRLGANPVRVEYGDFESNLPRSVRLAEVRPAGASGSDLRLTLSQVEINGALDADVFRVQVPGSATPITLDELRRSGPLGTPPPKG